MNIEQQIAQSVANAVQKLYGESIEPEKIQVVVTRKDQVGDYTVVVFPLLRLSKKSPDVTGAELGAAVVADVDGVDKFEVIKGFLNLSLSKEYWANKLTQAAADENYGFRTADDNAPQVMIE